MSSVSDEAFAMLILENSYDRWSDIFVQARGNVNPVRSGRVKVWESRVRTKFTDGGIHYRKDEDRKQVDDNDEKSKGVAGRGHKGWNKEGIARFNQLFDDIAEDRRNNPAFIQELLKRARSKAEGGKGNKLAKQRALPARNELGSNRVDDDPASSDHSDGDNDYNGNVEQV